MVLDAELPGMNGSAVLERLRAEGSSLPVLLLTPRTGVADTSATLRSGIDGHLCKPFRFEEILARPAMTDALWAS